MAYWKLIRGMSDPIPIRKFDGVYKPDDEGFNLQDGLFTELINFCPDQYPAYAYGTELSIQSSIGVGTKVTMRIPSEYNLKSLSQ